RNRYRYWYPFPQGQGRQPHHGSSLPLLVRPRVPRGARDLPRLRAPAASPGVPVIPAHECPTATVRPEEPVPHPRRPWPTGGSEPRPNAAPFVVLRVRPRPPAPGGSPPNRRSPPAPAVRGVLAGRLAADPTPGLLRAR